jgi:transcriptional regulator with XRE-family HTH domain
MEFHQLTASLFADKIGVQRSSISHILSGRNKPSLDFILKVTSVFSDVDMYWLLNGKGAFPKTTTISPTRSSNESAAVLPFAESNTKKIKRIVVFYEDGTFDEYHK